MSQNRSRSYIGQAQGHRPAWVEIDVAQLRQNFKIINEDKPVSVQILTVVKDQAYGHGAAKVAKIAIESGCKYLAVATIDEALELRRQDVTVPILVFGERTDEERKLCLEYGLACFVNDKTQTDYYSQLAASANKQTPVHVEVDTGLCRYGVHWTKAPSLIKHISGANNLFLEGIMSHFAMSDELDKSFALQQLRRFQEVLAKMNRLDLRVTFRHMCNTGGFLDLPQAHFDLVRIGILPLGVYPSQVCRRIPGLKPVMSVKTQIAAIRELETGDYVGYGMRYQAQSRRRIAVIPIGYGDGYPRVRNQGEVLIHGKRAAVIGGNAMDATMVDITDIPECRLWDEVVLMGRQDDDEIDAHEIAKLKNSVSYDVLAGWRWRLPRVYLTP